MLMKYFIVDGVERDNVTYKNQKEVSTLTLPNDFGKVQLSVANEPIQFSDIRPRSSYQ